MFAYRPICWPATGGFTLFYRRFPARNMLPFPPETLLRGFSSLPFRENNPSSAAKCPVIFVRMTIYLVWNVPSFRKKRTVSVIQGGGCRRFFSGLFPNQPTDILSWKRLLRILSFFLMRFSLLYICFCLPFSLYASCLNRSGRLCLRFYGQPFALARSRRFSRSGNDVLSDWHFGFAFLEPYKKRMTPSRITLFTVILTNGLMAFLFSIRMLTNSAFRNNYLRLVSFSIT